MELCWITQAYGILEEMVILYIGGIPQPVGNVMDREPPGITWLGNDSDAAILCDRAGCPSILAI